MKTKWDSLIQKLDYECSELMRELKVHEEARNRSILSLRTLNNEIQEIVDNLASGQSRVAHEVQIAWSFLERLEALKSQCFTDIESTTNSLERIGVQMDLKIKEKSTSSYKQSLHSLILWAQKQVKKQLKEENIAKNL